MKTLLYYLTIASLLSVFFSTFYVENSLDAHATCVTINGTEECSTPPPILTSIQSYYVPNQTIHLVGIFRANAMIQVDLVDPNNDIKNSVLFQSDSSAHFQNQLVVPNDAVNGTWKINISSGINHITYPITIISKNFIQNPSTENGITSACCYLHGPNSTNILQSPLKQLKSGIAANDVKCNPRSVLIIKWEDGSPACVKPDAKIQLLKIGWAVPGPKDFGYNPGRGPLAFHDPQSNGMNYHGLPTSPNIRILYNGTQSSRDAPFYVKQGQNVTLMVDVTSDPVNIPVSLYAEPHIGFTKTNGIDLELSDNMVNTPAKIILYMSISKDATPNTYQTLVKANTTGMGLDSHFFVKVIK